MRRNNHYLPFINEEVGASDLPEEPQACRCESLERHPSLSLNHQATASQHLPHRRGEQTHRAFLKKTRYQWLTSKACVTLNWKLIASTSGANIGTAEMCK